MKIVEPSTNIIESELAGLTPCQRIDRCAAVCYQRNPRSTPKEAEEFCRHLVERGHWAALEFSVVHLVMPDLVAIDYMDCRYMQVWLSERSTGIVTGSIRGFIEYGRRNHLVDRLLQRSFPFAFGDGDDIGNEIAEYRFATDAEIPWQHRHVAVRFVVSRAISHQLVRHRPCSFLQESQRYCRYTDEVEFIRPEWVPAEHQFNQPKYAPHEWEVAVCDAETRYRNLLVNGLSPQQARAVLPNSTKTELIMQAALPQWRHVLDLRCSAGVDPEMRRVMVPLLEQFQEQYPEMWEK